jgi:hypothetical protein
MTERSEGLGSFAEKWLRTGDVAKRAENLGQVKLASKDAERGGEAKAL